MRRLVGSSQGEDASLDDSVLVGIEGVFDHRSSCTFGSVLMLATGIKGVNVLLMHSLFGDVPCFHA